MKTILVATDFSATANNAFKYAKEFATVFNAKLVLFSAYTQVPAPVREAAVIITAGEMRQVTLRRLNDSLRESGDIAKVPVHVMCKEGAPAKTIMETAAEVDADLIITGMKEGGRGFRMTFGSTVTELARKTKVPMLVIPEKSRYTPVKSLALATEKDLELTESAEVVKIFQQVAQAYHSRVLMIRVAPDEVSEAVEMLNRPLRLNKILGSLDAEYECVRDSDVIAALNHFIETKNVDMLAMIPHRHSFMARLLYKHNTGTMAFETPVPLLVLPEYSINQES